MLQISKGARQYANPVYLKKLIEAAVSLSNIPIAVHLDHGDTFELCKECIDEGFTSVMIDASHEPFEKNVEITQEGRGIRPQAQLLGGIRARPSRRRAVRRRRGRRRVFRTAAITPIRRRRSNLSRNPVAIRWPSPSAIRHGAYKFKGEQHLDLERLKLIKKALMDAGPRRLSAGAARRLERAEISRRGNQQIRRQDARRRRACRKPTSKSRAAPAARR